MNSLWSITIDDYLNVVEICQKLGRKAGDSMEDVFLAYMQEKGKRPFGNTELTKEEFIADLVQRKGNILNIETDDKGKQTYKIHKQGENNNESSLDNDNPDVL
jgi:hypothetical protein